MVCKETAACSDHGFLFPEDVVAQDDGYACRHCGQAVQFGRVEKMSKSKKNVIDPNTLLDKYGADTTRLFCLFAAPPERDLEWSAQGVEGGFRFLNRVWRLAHKWMPAVASQAAFTGDDSELVGPARELYKKVHQTIYKVTRDIEDRFHFNTAISAVMELINVLSSFEPQTPDAKQLGVVRLTLETTTLLLAPIVPHFTEEIWNALGRGGSVLQADWPEYREDALSQDELTIVIQVNGKLRGRLHVAPGTPRSQIEKQALTDERARKFIADKTVRKVIVVPDKLVNIVV
jgi:leucyl-tRNA synthetase